MAIRTWRRSSLANGAMTRHSSRKRRRVAASVATVRVPVGEPFAGDVRHLRAAPVELAPSELGVPGHRVRCPRQLRELSAWKRSSGAIIVSAPSLDHRLDGPPGLGGSSTEG